MRKKPINVSMSTFATFASKTGQPKATLVRNWKYKPKYSPALDFYKTVREALPEYCRKNVLETDLDLLVAESSPKKRAHFKAAIGGFQTWKKTKSGKWVDPPVSEWHSNNLSIGIKPEIGFLSDEGVLTWVKLYFKSTKLTKYQADVYLELMASSLSVSRSMETVVSVLDVKESKEFLAGGSRPMVNALLRAEAAYWEVLWDAI
ncbi:MAG: hypothetical protein ACSHX5_06810 [Phycisphaerales bacterium]